MNPIRQKRGWPKFSRQSPSRPNSVHKSGAIAVQKAVVRVSLDIVLSNNLALVIDSVKGCQLCLWIIHIGVGAILVNESLQRCSRKLTRTNNHSAVVDCVRGRAARTRTGDCLEGTSGIEESRHNPVGTKATDNISEVVNSSRPSRTAAGHPEGLVCEFRFAFLRKSAGREKQDQKKRCAKLRSHGPPHFQTPRV